MEPSVFLTILFAIILTGMTILTRSLHMIEEGYGCACCGFFSFMFILFLFYHYYSYVGVYWQGGALMPVRILANLIVVG